VRRRRGMLGTLGLLDGTAWLRTVRRDTDAYRRWLKVRHRSNSPNALVRLHTTATHRRGLMPAQQGGPQPPAPALKLMGFDAAKAGGLPWPAPALFRPSVASGGALRALSVGGLHACASYGYPMAKGWLASVKQGAALLTWRRMTGVLNKVWRPSATSATAAVPAHPRRDPGERSGAPCAVSTAVVVLSPAAFPGLRSHCAPPLRLQMWRPWTGRRGARRGRPDARGIGGERGWRPVRDHDRQLAQRNFHPRLVRLREI
jgi:hypothetical protein